MKFSVLIPTKNRLDLLRMAIQSVLDQDFEDWEIIVADNASSDPVGEYVESLSDDRIWYARSDVSLPVTDNWNRAWSHARGEYIVMLGDDDALLPGYFRRNLQVIEQFENPDLVFVQGVQFAYPGVMPQHKGGFTVIANCRFIGYEREPFELSADLAREGVEDSLNFRVTYPYNMQYSLVKRDTTRKLAIDGRFYQSPYPDYYATNLLMMKADRIVVQPVPLICIGISPKSFGYFYFNDREDEGVQMLGNMPSAQELDKLRDIVLPGPAMNTSWLIALHRLLEVLGDRAGLKLSFDKYRYLQLRHAHQTLSPLGFLRFLFRNADAAETWRWLRILLRIRVRLLLGDADAVSGVLDAIHTAYQTAWTFTKPTNARDLGEFTRTSLPDDLLEVYLDARRAALEESRG